MISGIKIDLHHLLGLRVYRTLCVRYTNVMHISKMRSVLLITLLLTTCCAKTNSTTEQTVTDTTSISTESIRASHRDRVEEQTRLTDTTSNGFKLKFLELNEGAFDSLQLLTKRTSISLKPFTKQVTKLDSCLTFKLGNGKVDSLCNMDDGEYFEKYTIKGLWEEKDLLLVDFANWEEAHDFLINLKDGSYYILGPFYETAPGQDFVLSYVDISVAPIYSSELLLTKIEKGKLTVLLKENWVKRQ